MNKLMSKLYDKFYSTEKELDNLIEILDDIIEKYDDNDHEEYKENKERNTYHKLRMPLEGEEKMLMPDEFEKLAETISRKILTEVKKGIDDLRKELREELKSQRNLVKVANENAGKTLVNAVEINNKVDKMKKVVDAIAIDYLQSARRQIGELMRFIDEELPRLDAGTAGMEVVQEKVNTIQGLLNAMEQEIADRVAPPFKEELDRQVRYALKEINEMIVGSVQVAIDVTHRDANILMNFNRDRVFPELKQKLERVDNAIKRVEDRLKKVEAQTQPRVRGRGLA